MTNEERSEILRMLDEYRQECESCFNLAQILDAENPLLPGAFTGTPSERINRQLVALGVGGFCCMND